MISVRPATLLDLDAIVEMGARFYAVSGYTETHGPYDSQSAAATGVLLLHRGVVLIAERDGKPVGMIGLVLAPFLFNAARKTAHEVMWWVDPDARASRAGLLLIDQAERAARNCGAVSIQMIHLDTSPAAAAAVYKRRGYRMTESMYTKGL